MPQQIDVPGMGIVEFPDGMKDADISAAIQRSMPNQAAATPSPQMSNPNNFVGPDLPPSIDIKNVLPHLPIYAGAAIAGMPGDLASLVGLDKKLGLRTSESFRNEASDILGKPLYSPGTLEGKIVKGAAENAIGALGPGGIGARATQVVLPAAASEIAGEATQGTAAEPYMRVGAGLASGIGAGTMFAGRQAARTIPQLEQAARVTPEEVIANSAQQYQAIRNSGATVPAQEMGNFAAQARNAMASRFSDATAPAVYRELARLDNPPAGATTTAGDVLNLRQRLSEIARETNDFRPTPQAAAASATKQQLDAFLRRIDPNLADDIRAASNERRIGGLGRAIGDKAARAELQAASANSGMNVENAIRQQTRQIVQRPDMMRRFTPEVQQQLRDIVEGNATVNTLRTIGNLLGGGGGLGAMVSSLLGSMAHPLGAFAPAVGFGIKSAGNASARRALDNVQQAALSQSALSQARQANIQPQIEAARQAIMSSKMSAARKSAMLQSLNKFSSQAGNIVRAEDNQP
jgi:hypothetical protein